MGGDLRRGSNSRASVGVWVQESRPLMETPKPLGTKLWAGNQSKLKEGKLSIYGHSCDEWISLADNQTRDLQALNWYHGSGCPMRSVPHMGLTLQVEGWGVNAVVAAAARSCRGGGTQAGADSDDFPACDNDGTKCRACFYSAVLIIVMTLLGSRCWGWWWLRRRLGQALVAWALTARACHFRPQKLSLHFPEQNQQGF